MVISKVLRISNGAAPYTYTVSTNACVSVNSLTGVLNENEPKLLIFDIGANCPSDIVINIVDNNGCATIQNYNLDAACNIVLSLTQNNYSFVATASGGTGQYTYNWVFDTNMFSVITNIDNLLTLSPIGIQQPSAITCIVTDNNGCSKAAQITFQPCSGVLSSNNVETYCVSSDYVSNNIELIYTGCDTPNWNTLIVTPFNGLVGVLWRYEVVSITGNSIFLRVFIPIKDVAAPTTVVLNASVKNNFGVTTLLSNTEIKISINGCQPFQGSVQGISSIQKVGEGSPVGQTLIKKVEDYVISTYPLDWDSFTFIANAGQTFYAKGDVLTQVGDAFFTINHEISLEIVNVPLHDVEIISWKIADVYGTFSNVVDDIFILKTIAAPIVGDDTLCMIMNQFTAINSILDNDTDYVIASFTVTQQPLHGTIVIQGSSLYFSPATNFHGTDVFKYKIANANGVYSAEATVNLTIISSGVFINANNIIC